MFTSIGRQLPRVAAGFGCALTLLGGRPTVPAYGVIAHHVASGNQARADTSGDGAPCDTNGCIVGSVRLQGRPTDAVVDSATGRAFVIEEGDYASTLDVVDLARGRLVTAVPLPGQAGLGMGMVLDDGANRVFVVDKGPFDDKTGLLTGHGRVTVLDATTGAVVRTVPVGTIPVVITDDPSSGRVFVLNQNAQPTRPVGRSSVSVLDARTGALLRTVPVGFIATRLVVDARAERVFVVNQGRGSSDDSYRPVGPGSVSVLNSRTGTLIGATTVGQAPRTIIVNAVAGRVFVVNQGPFDPYTESASGPSTVSVLDAVTGRAQRTTTIARALDIATLDQATGRLFVGTGAVGSDSVSGYSPSGVAVLDATTGALLRAVALPQRDAADHLRALAVDARTARLFALEGGDNGRKGRVSVLDATSGAIVGRTDLGPIPTAEVVDERRGHVLVAYWGDDIDVHDYTSSTFGALGPGYVGVLDADGKVIATLTVGVGPTAVVLDGRTGRLLVLNQNTLTVLDTTHPQSAS